jgi:hypothetical protein
MKGGAFPTKPRSGTDAVEAGLARDRGRQESDRALPRLEAFETPRSREREIMVQVTWSPNKQINTSASPTDGEMHEPDAEDARPLASELSRMATPQNRNRKPPRACGPLIPRAPAREAFNFAQPSVCAFATAVIQLSTQTSSQLLNSHWKP